MDDVLAGGSGEVVAATVEELFDGLFHDKIELVGKALTGATLLTVVYRKLAASLLDRSVLSYALDSHVPVGFERATMATREFQRALSERLNQPDAFPVDDIKASLHDKKLTRDEKLAKWGDVRRLSLGAVLVTTYLSTVFYVLTSIRSTLLVLMFLKQKAAKKRSKWEILKKLRQTRASAALQSSSTSGGDDGPFTTFGESAGSALLPAMMDLMAETLGAASDTPFDHDAPSGHCSVPHLTDVLLDAVPQLVDCAMMVVDATLAQAAEGVDGSCDAVCLTVLFELVIGAFQGEGVRDVPLWKIFSPISRIASLPPSPTAAQTSAPKIKPSSRSSSPRVAGSSTVDTPFESTNRTPSESKDQRSSSASIDSACGDMPSGAFSSVESEREALRAATPHVVHPDMTAAARELLTAYLSDLFVASDEPSTLIDTLVLYQLRNHAHSCVANLESSPQYQKGSRAMLHAITKLDMLRLEVVHGYSVVQEVPMCVQVFCQEMLKASCRASDIR